MNWDNATVLKFLQLYKINSCIWDPQDDYHKNRQCVGDAWNNIKENMGLPCTVKQLKKKKESLMAAYRGYKGKIRKSQRSGDDVYRPTWFAFSLMDSFLGSVYTCKSTVKTEGEGSEEQDILDSDATSESSDVLQRQDIFRESSMSPSPNQHHPSSDHKETPVASLAPKKRRHNPSDLIQAHKHMELAFHYMKNAYQHQRSQNDDDECSVFGELVAKKLRRLSEERRDVMMAKIHQLFIDERLN